MFEFKDLDAFIAKVEQWEKDATETVTAVARGYAAEAYHNLLDWSPQYSGDFTANWVYELNGITPSFRPGLVPSQEPTLAQHEKNSYLDPRAIGVSAWIMGAPEAIAVAIERNAGKDEAFKLGDMVYMHNSAAHDEPYAMLIQENAIKFRPGNTGATVTHATTAMQKYETLDQSATALMSRRV
jgi:hypothetical protein